jgi:hypothetical protein
VGVAVALREYDGAFVRVGGGHERMKINFTKKEYQTLVEMLLVADWVIRSDEEEPRAETEPYGALRKKVLSHFREMGMGEDFQYDQQADEYFETSEYEARAPHVRFLSEYDERMFWSQLADRLAARDLAANGTRNTEQAVGAEERLVRLFEAIEAYEEEFAEHGLDHVRIVSDATPRMH